MNTPQNILRLLIINLLPWPVSQPANIVCAEASFEHLITFADHAGYEGRTDRFGESIAVVGDRVFIGAMLSDTGASETGEVFVFDRNANYLFNISDPDPNDLNGFGGHVRAVGDLGVVVVSRGSDIASRDSGAAHLFDVNGNLLHTFTDPLAGPGSGLGIGIAARENLIALGAWDSGAAGPGLGAVYLFDVQETFIRTFTSPYALNTGQDFGRSIAFVGEDRILIGDHFDSTGNTRAGAAFLFDLNGDLLRTFLNPTPKDREQEGFGGSLAVVGDKLLIGTTQESSQVDFSGGAYLFSQDGTLLNEILDPEPAFENWFGWSLMTVDDERFIIGSIFNDELGDNAGKAYLYNADGEILQEFLSPDPDAGDHFGISFSLIGEDLLIGEHAAEPGYDKNGQIYLYQPVSIDGDANLDGTVNLADFSLLKDHFGTGDRFRFGDFDRDLDVDVEDFSILKGSFGRIAESDSANNGIVPEPPSSTLCTIGILAMSFFLRGRRTTCK